MGIFIKPNRCELVILMDKTRGTVLNYSHDHILLTVWGKSLKSVVFGNSCPIRVWPYAQQNFRIFGLEYLPRATKNLVHMVLCYILNLSTRVTFILQNQVSRIPLNHIF